MTVALLIGLGAVLGGGLAVLAGLALRRMTGAAGWWPGRVRGPEAGQVGEALARVEDQLRRMEADRQNATGGMTQQLRALQESQELMRGETARLGRALREPSARGRWGELQLRRVVEMAGMLAQCDFVEQPVLAGLDGPLRPDMVVRLPGGRSLVVDAKVPLRGWLEALEATDDVTCRARLADHARQLRAHVGALSAKEYWAALSGSPEMVVAFVPADGLLAAALETDPSLLDFAVSRRVMLATPMTLIAMLRAVSYGWQQEALVDDARAVADLGRDLYRRLGTLSEHLSGLGRSLDRAVGAFNQTVGSLESRVMVTARRLGDMGGPGLAPPTPAPSLSVTRAVLVSPDADDRPDWAAPDPAGGVVEEAG
ncbi:MAG TPA: DNA recombination protein RmuC [Acidimicrobiales bacterium]|nr:DNA recombination protein RmuC [Acidimicrobiales bacterium]